MNIYACFLILILSFLTIQNFGTEYKLSSEEVLDHLMKNSFIDDFALLDELDETIAKISKKVKRKLDQESKNPLARKLELGIFSKMFEPETESGNSIMAPMNIFEGMVSSMGTSPRILIRLLRKFDFED